jgi:hypothetical protein
MLNTLLNQIQTQLLSKKFLLGTLFPLFLFIFGNGWMIWLHCQDFRHWVATIDNLKDGSILATVLTTLVLFVAYALSGLSATLLDCLEGKKGPLLWLGAPLYRYEQSKLKSIKKQYDEIARNTVQLKNVLDPENDNWLKRLERARIKGEATNACDQNWQTSPGAHQVERVLHRYHYGRPISFESSRDACQALESLLVANSSTLQNKSSQSLKKMLEEFQQAIVYARDVSQFKRIQLYNKRQMCYPGDMNPVAAGDVSPQNVLYPTTMGNIGSTMRSYAISRYSLDLDIFWSRLQSCVQSDNNYFGVLQDVKVQLDFLVTSFWLTGVFALIWTPIAFYEGSLLEFLAVGASGFLPLFLYSLACDAYLLFADLMRGAVDLYRFKLAVNLNLPLPGGTEEERLFWTRLGNIIGYASEERLSYKHPGA